MNTTTAAPAPAMTDAEWLAAPVALPLDAARYERATTEQARVEAHNATLARTQNTYAVSVLLRSGAETDLTVYASAVDIAARKAKRHPGVRAVGRITRTHIKGRAVAQ